MKNIYLLYMNHDKLFMQYFPLDHQLNFSNCSTHMGNRDCSIVHLLPFFENLKEFIGKELRNFYIRPVDNYFDEMRFKYESVSIYEMSVEQIMEFLAQIYDPQPLILSIMSKKKIRTKKIIPKFDEYVEGIINYIKTKDNGKYIIPFESIGHVTNLLIEKINKRINVKILELQLSNPFLDYKKYIKLNSERLIQTQFFFEEGDDVQFNKNKLVEKIIYVIFIGLGYGRLLVMAKKFGNKIIVKDLKTFTYKVLIEYIKYHQGILDTGINTLEDFKQHFRLKKLTPNFIQPLNNLKGHFLNLYRKQLRIYVTLKKLQEWSKNKIKRTGNKKIPKYYVILMKKLLKNIQYSNEERNKIKRSEKIFKHWDIRNIQKNNRLYLTTIEPTNNNQNSTNLPYYFTKAPIEQWFLETLGEIFRYMNIGNINIIYNFIQMMQLAYTKIILENKNNNLGIQDYDQQYISIGYPHELQECYIEYAEKLKNRNPYIQYFYESSIRIYNEYKANPSNLTNQQLLNLRNKLRNQQVLNSGNKQVFNHYQHLLNIYMNESKQRQRQMEMQKQMERQMEMQKQMEMQREKRIQMEIQKKSEDNCQDQ